MTQYVLKALGFLALEATILGISFLAGATIITTIGTAAGVMALFLLYVVYKNCKSVKPSALSVVLASAYPDEPFCKEETTKVLQYLKEWENEVWFKEWMALTSPQFANKVPFSTLDEAMDYLMPLFRMGTCHGQAKILARLLREEGNKTSAELRTRLIENTHSILKYQLINIICIPLKNSWPVFFVPKEERERNAQKEFTLFKMENEGLLLDFQQRLQPLDQWNLALLKAKLKKIQELPGAFITISSPKNLGGNHIFTIQFSPKFRVYDPFNDEETGFYDISNLDEMSNFLWKHIKKYYKATAFKIEPFKFGEKSSSPGKLLIFN